MKKMFLIFIVAFKAISNAFPQNMNEVAERVIKEEGKKIQYVFEGEIVNVELYAGEHNGTRLTGKDIVWDKNSQGYSYRKLSDGGGPVCYSIASIKICKLYKGEGISDTIKILTANNGYFYITFNGTDTLIEYSMGDVTRCFGSWGESFYHKGMKGFKAIFFAFNHNYTTISNQIKTESQIGNIQLRDIYWNPSSNDTTDWIFANSDGPLNYRQPHFYSRTELNDFLMHLPIKKIKVKYRNLCITEKERTTKPRTPN